MQPILPSTHTQLKHSTRSFAGAGHPAVDRERAHQRLQLDALCCLWPPLPSRRRQHKHAKLERPRPGSAPTAIVCEATTTSLFINSIVVVVRIVIVLISVFCNVANLFLPVIIIIVIFIAIVTAIQTLILNDVANASSLTGSICTIPHAILVFVELQYRSWHRKCNSPFLFGEFGTLEFRQLVVWCSSWNFHLLFNGILVSFCHLIGRF